MKNFFKTAVTALVSMTVMFICGFFPVENVDTIQYIANLEEVNTIEIGNVSLKDNIKYDVSKYLLVNNTPITSQPSSSTTTSIISPSITQSVSYKKVDQYLYVNTDILNVRTGPSSSYKKVGTLSKGVKVHRVEVGTNGWSKIEYKGNIRYVSSKYLTLKKPTKVVKNSILEEKKQRGNVGRLKISSVGVDVALFEVSSYDSKKNQAVVDRTDSAAYMTDANDYFGFTIIGDHSKQGFSKIKNTTPGKTTAVIDYGTYKEKYICTKKFKGRNEGVLVDLDGNSIAGKNDGGLTMYTCNADGTITITFWKKI